MKNEKYSQKSFNNQDLSNESSSDFEGEIIGSNFYQENKPNSEIFPQGITTTFIRCNLDNVKVPSGCTMIDCTNKKIKVQNDLSDWILDDDGNPTEPMDKKLREFDISTSPDSIPSKKQTKTVFQKKADGEF